jgi:hypothetical protein
VTLRFGGPKRQRGPIQGGCEAGVSGLASFSVTQRRTATLTVTPNRGTRVRSTTSVSPQLLPSPPNPTRVSSTPIPASAQRPGTPDASSNRVTTQCSPQLPAIRRPDERRSQSQRRDIVGWSERTRRGTTNVLSETDVRPAVAHPSGDLGAGLGFRAERASVGHGPDSIFHDRCGRNKTESRSASANNPPYLSFLRRNRRLRSTDVRPDRLST